MLEIPEIGLTIHDLVGGNSQYIEEYLAIYQELLPQYYRYAPVMRQRAEKPVEASANEQWHQWLVFMGNRPIGMIGILYNRKRNTGILLDFAIRPEARAIQYHGHKRLAGLILELAMEQLTRDAQANGYEYPLCMIAEVEHASLVKTYLKYGYIEFSVEYFEPPYTPELAENCDDAQSLDKIGYKRLFLGAFQIPGHPFDPGDPAILEAVLLTLLEDHYCIPPDHWLVQKMFKEIRGQIKEEIHDHK